jgi:flagellar basal-body rod modification protein FlgD
VSTVNNTTNSSLDALRWQTEAKTDAAATTNKKTLEQSDFFKLLSNQLAFQDPSKPVDNNQMVSQMTSFSTLQGITDMTSQLKSLNSVMTSNQALQASTLVGKKVLMPSNEGYVNGNEGVDGKLSLTNGATDISIRVENSSGELVKTFTLAESQGKTLTGNVDYSWDGTNESGEKVPAGKYTVKASGLVNGKTEELTLANYAHIQSVSLGSSSSSDVVLNLRGMGGLKLSDAIEVAS